MIEINLLPEELKAKTKIKVKKPEASAPAAVIVTQEPKYFLLIAPAAIALLILANLFFGIANLGKVGQLRSLNAKWKALEPQRKIAEEFNRTNTLYSEDAKAIQQIENQRINWAQKLNALSLKLPSGIWFSDITVTQKELSLSGSVVSLKKEEMSLLKDFVDALKQDPAFANDFNTLDLGAVQKRSIGGLEVTDFVISGALKPR